jgi:predicted Zn-dependent protease
MSLRTIGAVVAALAILTGFTAGCDRSVTAGRASPLGADEEIAIGRAGAAQVLDRFGGDLDVPMIQAYVRTIGERVARPAGQVRWPYRFTVLASGQPRLFSLPGGQVFVTRGFLAQLDSEAELAGLLARQFVLIERHYDEVQAKMSSSVLVEAAAAAAARLNHQRPGRGADESLAKVVAAWTAIGYADGQESEADLRGLDYLVAAGYHPEEMVRLVKRFGHPLSASADAWARAVRLAVDRKYPADGGRVGREEFHREVLDRLKSLPPATENPQAKG